MSGTSFPIIYVRGSKVYFQASQSVLALTAVPTTETNISISANVPANALDADFNYTFDNATAATGEYTVNFRSATGVNEVTLTLGVSVRLDYLQRDKLMTGTGAGAIDFDWLIENVRVADIELDAPDELGGDFRKVPTFCLTKKALPAAEQFLLARYTLHQQVYFHKATRCVEHVIGKLLRAIARLAAGKKVDHRKTGLPDGHPLLSFFSRSDATIASYLALDDAVVIGSLDAMSRATDAMISDTAKRLRDRHLYKTLDLAEFGEDQGRQRSKLRRITNDNKAKIEAEEVLIDDKASIGIYAEIGGDEERMHKKLHVLDGGQPQEISKLSNLIEALVTKRQFTRLYFADVADRDAARQ